MAFLRRHPAGLKTIAGLAILIVALLALWKIPQWQVPPDQVPDAIKRLELQDKARGTLAQIIGGMVVLVGLYFTGRSAAAAWRNVQVTQEGQITERFTRAIEQLGSDTLAIRLGGIYALERWRDTPQPQEGTAPELEEPTPERNTQQETPQSAPKPAADIQAILTVLGRRTRWYGQGEDRHLDLHGTSLEGAYLQGAHLEHAFLSGTHLEGAYLREAAIFPSFGLQGEVNDQAHLERADLQEATGLTKEQLASAITDETALLPTYLTAEDSQTTPEHHDTAAP